MNIRKLEDCNLITAADGTCLRELIHPDREYSFRGRYSLAHAILPAGKRSAKHRLESDELYYIISGKGNMHIDGEEAEVSSGDAVEIPPGSVQWLENNTAEAVEFLCIVDPAWQPEDEEIL